MRTTADTKHWSIFRDLRDSNALLDELRRTEQMSRQLRDDVRGWRSAVEARHREQK